MSLQMHPSVVSTHVLLFAFVYIYIYLGTCETLRAQYGEDGVGRRKSGPIASRATSGRLA